MSYLRILTILIWFKISTAVEIPLTLVFPGRAKVTSKISVKPGFSQSLSRKTRFRAEELCQVRRQIMTEIEFRHAFCRSELGKRLRDNVIMDMKKWRGYHRLVKISYVSKSITGEIHLSSNIVVHPFI